MFRGLPGCRLIPRPNPPQADVNQWAVVKEIMAWVKKNDLGRDVHFYTPEAWLARGERFGKGSYFVMTFEGPLYNVFNGYDRRAGRLIEELAAIVAKYGLYFEQGEAWNAAAYAK